MSDPRDPFWHFLPMFILLGIISIGFIGVIIWGAIGYESHPPGPVESACVQDGELVPCPVAP